MRPALLPLLAAIATPAIAGPADLHSIAGMQSYYRVLIAFAPRLSDPRLRAQAAEMARFGAGAAERDLLFVQVGDGKVIGASDTPARLAARYRVPANAFRSLLIGKDGTVALTQASPIAAATLRARIDAMPMRREEARRMRPGLGKPKP
ncbi:DUF4174 domain-containing protein [Sphingomonas bacterium]|uniref:DUF4174 domain-containing protein n=1 Tax=Sphingomonas bacterium TaxID=1895847 RepID=UPI0015756C6A|nr:DUF4174 domain-containing protein [Sphingomonas bacterium]